MKNFAIRKLGLLFVLLITTTFGWAVGPVTESYFGMTEHNVQQNGFPLVPAGILRINNDQFNQFGHGTTNVKWSDLETCDGGTNQASACYHFGLLDYLVNAYTGAGYSTIYTFGYTPNWASSQPAGACEGTHPAGSCYPPSNQQYWKDFVTVMVNRYNGSNGHGRIKYWGVWNEPNSCTGGVGAFWYGCGSTTSLDDLAQMALDAYPIVHAVSGNLTITPDPQGPSADTYLGNYLTRAAVQCSAIGNGVCTDVVGFHAYVNAVNLGNMETTLSANMIDGITAAMTAHSVGSLPLWDTESGWGLDTEYPNFDLEASFPVRHHLLEWSKGVKHGSWWAWSDTTQGTLYSSPNIGQAGVAWQQMHDWIIGGTLNSPCTANGTVWSCNITQSNGNSALAMWDSSQTCSGGTFTASGTCVAPLRTVASQYARYLTIANSTSHAIVANQVPVGIKPILLLAVAGVNDFYVSNGGNDANTVTQAQSQATPWKTIQHALNAFTLGSGGSTIHVAAGTYNENISYSGSGTSTQRITIVSDIQYGAHIVGQAAGGNVVHIGTGATAHGGNYVTVQNFEVTGTTSNQGILLQGNHDIAIGNKVHAIQRNGTCPSGGGLGIGTQWNGVTPAGGPSEPSGQNFNLIQGNTVYDIGNFPSLCNFTHGIYLQTPLNTAWANIVFHAAGYGVQTFHYTGQQVIKHNTIFQNSESGIFISQDNIVPDDFNTITNNIVVNNNTNNTSAGIRQGGTGTHNLISNNMTFGNVGGGYLLQVGSAVNQITTGSNATVFVNYTGNETGDYHLRAGSPAIHVGTVACATGTCNAGNDFAGNPYASPPSLGAYEAGATTIQPPTGLTATVN